MWAEKRKRQTYETNKTRDAKPQKRVEMERSESEREMLTRYLLTSKQTHICFLPAERLESFRLLCASLRIH